MGAAALAVEFATAPLDAARAAQASATFSVGITILPADAQAPVRPADPFAASTWYAVDGPWPGTVHFDGETRTVHLDLVGAQPVVASYRYAFEPNAAAGNATGQHGTLHLRQMNGLTIDLAFRLSNDGKNLTLVFRRSAIAQHYVRMAAQGHAGDPNQRPTVMPRK